MGTQGQTGVSGSYSALLVFFFFPPFAGFLPLISWALPAGCWATIWGSERWLSAVRPQAPQPPAQLKPLCPLPRSPFFLGGGSLNHPPPQVQSSAASFSFAGMPETSLESAILILLCTYRSSLSFKTPQWLWRASWPKQEMYPSWTSVRKGIHQSSGP